MRNTAGLLTSLRIVSIAYLVTPSLLFLTTWIKPIYGYLSALLLSWVLWQTAVRIKSAASFVPRSLTVHNLIGVCLLALSMSLTFGFGEFNYQTLDYQNNNFKFYDLATHEWPVYIEQYNAYLCYYTAYYLPVSWLCKVFGLAYGRYFALIWSWLGISLLWAWVLVLAPRRAWWIIVLLLLYNDSWVFVWLLRAVGFEQHLPPNFVNINGFMLTSMTPYSDQIAWALQHLLPAAIGVFYLLFLHEHFSAWSAVEIALIGLGTLLWSPFATVGLLPFMLLAVWPHRRELLLNRGVLVAWGALFLCSLPIVSYLTGTQATGSRVTNMFIWQAGVPEWPLYYGLYVSVNFLLWVLFVKQLPQFMLSFYRLALLLLCLIPLYRIGVYNDFQVRTNIAALCVLSFCVAHTFATTKPLTHLRYIVFGLLFGINALSTIRFYSNLLPFTTPENSIERPFLHGCTNTFDFLAKMYNGPQTARQYMLKEDSLFETYFMKAPADQPSKKSVTSQ